MSIKVSAKSALEITISLYMENKITLEQTKERLKKAERVIELYADSKKWVNIPVKPWQSGFKFFKYKNQDGFELAREYQKKYMSGDSDELQRKN